MTPIPKMYVLDAYHPDVDAIIYSLIFTIYEIHANDTYQDLSMVFQICPANPEQMKNYESLWQETIDRSKISANTFHNIKQMQEFTQNPPTFKDAITHFHEWLKNHNIKPTTDALVKIWW